MFVAVFSVFVVAMLVLVVFIVRWADSPRPRASRRAEVATRHAHLVFACALEFLQGAIDVRDGAFDDRQSSGQLLFDQRLDAIVELLVDAAIHLFAQTRVEVVDEGLGELLQAALEILDLGRGVASATRLSSWSFVSLMEPIYGAVARSRRRR